MNYWNEKLQYSLSAQQEFDISILKQHIPHCVSITKTNDELDKLGIDYIATLDDGAEIYIDAKTRMAGCSRFWKNGPELALEIWSVRGSKIGWTLNNNTLVDYILYTFPKCDTDLYFFIPFQLLRKAFYKNGRKWVAKYGTKIQENESWESEAIFVPAREVVLAILHCMYGKDENKEETKS